MTREEQESALMALENEVAACRGCALCQTRTQTVCGRGRAGARILFVGEAPGAEEDRQGKPFVGPAGQLLDLFLEAVGLEEEDYYIANVLKCRPPHNRDPLPEEEDACLPFLRRQVGILELAILVCLGRISAQRIISPDFRITRDRGKWFERGATRITATFHPSALLRDPSKREEALTDFKSVAKELEKIRKSSDC